MSDRLTPTQKAIQARTQAGKTMYQGAPDDTPDVVSSSDDLWDEVETPSGRAWRFTAAGLTLERELSDTDWVDLTTGIRVMKSAQQLNVGDATLYGLERGYIKNYEDMEKLTGYKASTIELFASLCRSIPRLVRTNSLTYSHYQQIAPLPEAERETWIQFAAAYNLSYRALKSLIADATAPRLPESTGDVDWSEGMPDGVTVELIGQYPPPLSDETEEEATPIIREPSSLEEPESWLSVGYIERVVKTGSYRNLTDDQAANIRKRIANARIAIALLEAELPKPKRKKR